MMKGVNTYICFPEAPSLLVAVLAMVDDDLLIMFFFRYGIFFRLEPNQIQQLSVGRCLCTVVVTGTRTAYTKE